MEKYIGVKIITAQPCPAWKDAGGHKIGDAGYKVIYEDGYESWSPKDVFEKAYHKFNGMTFGQAVEAIKLGKKATRKGWNGKGMWLMLVLTPPTEAIHVAGTFYSFLPYIQMKTADDKMVPWLASQSDILAEDWEIVD